MTPKPLEIYAINARILSDVKKNGKDCWKIQIDYDAGDAVDRIQACVDYRLPAHAKLSGNIFILSGMFITWAWWPRTATSSYLVTCRCAHDIELGEAERLIKLGMRKANIRMSQIENNRRKKL